MEMTFTLGNVVQIATTLVAVLGAYAKLSERLAVVETETKRLTTIERKVDDMWDRRGRGRTQD